MTNRKPTEELEHEHRIIQQVVGGMAVLIEKLESGKEIDPAVLTDLSEFMQTFGDRLPPWERRTVPVQAPGEEGRTCERLSPGSSSSRA